MKYKLSFIFCRQPIFLLSFFMGLFFSLSHLQGQPVGRTQAVPINSFLNGIFPAETPGTAQGDARYEVENAFPKLTFIDPVKMLEMPGNRFMIIGKSGHVWMFDNRPDVSVKIQLLNLKSQVAIGEDGGMLGGALHPEFGQSGSPNEGYFYLWYRYTPRKGTNGDFGYMRLSRFTFDKEDERVDPQSEYVLIQQFDRHDWHNGGDMFFGPKGFLHIAVGDEGGARDQFNVTQQIDKWLFSGVLRIDVDEQGGAISHPIRRHPRNQTNPPSGWPDSYTQGYYIPNDNPWQNESGNILEEFWAVGLRSPHRMTYDEETGDIWVGDVGQNQQEEVSIVKKEDNLQWPYKEGTANGFKSKPSNLIGRDKAPIFSYGRGEGQSVIGGYMYRGDKYPELKGKYIYADHETQNVSIFTPNENKTGGRKEFLLNIPIEGVSNKDGISSFALDQAATIYILDLFGTDRDGAKVRKLVRKGGSIPDPPRRLSDLEVFTNMEELTPANYLLPYEINAPFWSDGALKKRWIILPNDGSYDSENEQIEFSRTGNWDFPSGTVLIKHFDLPLDRRDLSKTRKLETRFFIYSDEEEAYGLTYRWNDEGTEAFLLTDGESESFTVLNESGQEETQTWLFPARQQCMSCHNQNAGYVLGVRTRQINGSALYPTTQIEAHQLETWDFLGIFGESLGNLAHLEKNDPLLQTQNSLEFRVRSYLDANCSYCHQPGGVSGAFDARGVTPLYEQNLIHTTVISNSSPPGAQILIPGNPENSHLWVRSTTAGTNAMPPVGRNVIDAPYITQLSEWITELDPSLPANISEGWYLLAANEDSLVLGLESQTGSEGANIGLDDFSNQSSQIWFLQHRGNRKISLRARHSNQEIAYRDMESSEGSQVVQEKDRALQDQYWYPFRVEDDQYVLRNVYNGLYLGTGTNGQLSLWVGSLSTATRWRLLPYQDTQVSSCLEPSTSFLSDLDWLGEAENGWGPVERDLSNGETEPEDGRTLQINGTAYEKGLGVHAYSELRYALDEKYDVFTSEIGVDDETCGGASVQFEVFVDELLVYTSPLMRKGENALHIEVPVSGAQELRLVVNNGSPALAENSKSCDHANWANARLLSCLQPEVPEDTTDISVSLDTEILPSVRIYPNPASERIQVSWDQGQVQGEVHVELISLDGKGVLRQDSNQPVELSVGTLSRGLYILQVMQGDKAYRSKVLLQ
ncbi:MAG: NPCBM/NEW2 domain-containing protein [Bacteroidota bacterium]